MNPHIQKIQQELTHLTDPQHTHHIQEIQKHLQQITQTPPPPKYHATSQPQNQLGPTPNIHDENWPQAVDPTMITTTETTKQFRALQITQLLPPHHNHNTLDLGCGEGHTTKEIANTAKKVTGYDHTPHPNWQNQTKDNLILTTNKTTVQEQAPYDTIIIYDVLDHTTNDTPQNLLKWATTLLTPNGTIFLRTHPWTSRTGAHTYETHNKAYIHLALTTEEQIEQNIPQQPNQKITRPMAAYEHWIKEAQLQITDKKVKTTPIEPYITQHLLPRIIKINWNGNLDPNTAQKILTNTYIDYTLKKQ